MNELDQKIIDAVKVAVKNVYDIEPDESMLMVESPRDPKMGDYSTNIAMRLARSLRKNPFDIANGLVEAIAKELPEMESVTVARPGFINFKVKTSTLTGIINHIIEKDYLYGINDSGKDKNILVEYVSANPTGDLHCGHARNACWGDCMTRILKASGYNCLREFYINDAGNQIDMLGKSLIARYYEALGHEGEYELPENGYHAEDIKGIAKDIVDMDGDKWLNVKDEDGRMDYFKAEGVKRELKKIQDDLRLYRCEFDSWMHETFFYKNDSKRINDVLDKMAEMGLTYEKDGALWFKSSEYGDDKDRVLRKSTGYLSYLTPDIANHVYKYQRGYEKMVNLWGADHHSYVTRMNCALTALGYPKGTLEVDLIQMVRMTENGKEVKMSKRTGNAITIRELCEDVGVDAARWFFVSKDVATHMDFDLGLARSKNTENPVYYAQYAYTRMYSVLNNPAIPLFHQEINYELLTDEKELQMLKQISEFPGVVADAAATRMPNKICNYILTLAKNFHSYYGNTKVNLPENLELTNQRLGLVKACEITMKNALNLLGIEAPTHM